MKKIFFLMNVIFLLAGGRPTKNATSGMGTFDLQSTVKTGAPASACTAASTGTLCSPREVPDNLIFSDGPGTRLYSKLARSIQRGPTAQQGSGTTNVASKPPASGDHGTVCYASYWGNDSNDGLSLGTAMHSIMGCYDALAAGGGFIYIYDGGSEEFPVSATSMVGCGIWIMGSGDPNFRNPPACWRTVKPVTFVGAGGSHSIAHIMAGGQADQNHPAIWLSGTSASLRFENLSYQYPNVGIRLGCNSNLNCSDGTGGVSGARFDNVVGHINQGAGNGPDVFIGSNSFWDFFYNCGFQGNSAEQVGITALSRASNVLTVTTSAAFRVTVGQHLGIVQAGDSTFNSSFTVASVTNTTHFTVTQIGPNATSSGGTVITDKQIPIVADSGSGTGSGLIYVSGQSGGNVFSLGGVRLWPGVNGGGIYVDHFTVEGDFSHVVAPGVWIGNATPLPIDVRVDSIEMADVIGPTPTPAVKIDCSTSPCLLNNVPSLGDNIVVTKTSNPTLGPHSGLGSLPTDGSISPLRTGFSGVANGQLVGQSDAARRMFSPAGTSHGATNLADTNAANWTSAGGAVTTGIAAPNGTMNAGQFTGGIGIIPWSRGPALATNVIYIFGAWVRSAKANGFAGGHSLRLDTNANGYGAGNDCNASGSGQAYSSFRNYDDGEWEYDVGICKMTSAGTTIGPQLVASADGSHTTQVYAPVVLAFPQGAISDNEAFEIMNNLVSIPMNCPAGGVCMMPGQTLGIAGSTPYMGLFTHGNTTNREYFMPDASGTVSLVLKGVTGEIGGAALTVGQCASGTVKISGATTSMTVSVSPNTDPGGGFIPWGYVSSNGTATVKVCALIGGRPTKSTYNVRVVQ